MLWKSSGKLYHLSKETRMKRKRKAFVKVLEKVKLVLVNIRFRLDISMPIMVTNPSIGFGAWHEQLGFVKILNPFAKFSIKPKLDEKNPFHPPIHNSKFAFEKTINGFGICV